MGMSQCQHSAAQCQALRQLEYRFQHGQQQLVHRDANAQLRMPRMLVRRELLEIGVGDGFESEPVGRGLVPVMLVGGDGHVQALLLQATTDDQKGQHIAEGTDGH
jgi:hypothetical protein